MSTLSKCEHFYRFFFFFSFLSQPNFAPLSLNIQRVNGFNWLTVSVGYLRFDCLSVGCLFTQLDNKRIHRQVDLFGTELLGLFHFAFAVILTAAPPKAPIWLAKPCVNTEPGTVFMHTSFGLLLTLPQARQLTASRLRRGEKNS